ncbi:GGDEF domain-containing protein [Prodigiosinella confusarubida]|uniref:GGDEF domain-containing protein n=1 Tax=Serratia sp. (strain ATCC 39006) TaxID=104623 RepID=UPI0012FEDE87
MDWLDIGHFKQVNDEYGHAIGDNVLIYFSSLIKNHICRNDYVLRMGGEAFCILLTNTNLSEATTVVKNT